MSTFPFAMIVSQSAMANELRGSGAASGTRSGQGLEFLSALPDAPVVPDRPSRRPRTHRARSALAATLRRAATAIAPPAECHPAAQSPRAAAAS